MFYSFLHETVIIAITNLLLTIADKRCRSRRKRYPGINTVGKRYVVCST